MNKNKFHKIYYLVFSILIILGLSADLHFLLGASNVLLIQEFKAEQTGFSSSQGGAINFKIKACDTRVGNLSASLNYGDGNVENFNLQCGQEIIKTRAYNYSATTMVTLNVNNGIGDQKTRQLQIDIKSLPSFIKAFNINPLSNLNPNQTTVFDISICDSLGDITRANLMPGDGRTIPIDTTCDLSSYSVVYQNSGNYTATISIQDSVGNTAQQSIPVNIGGVPLPVIVNNSTTSNNIITITNQNDLRGKLVKTSSSNDIYYITQSLRQKKILNNIVMQSYGDNLQNVLTITNDQLQWYPVVKLIHLDNEFPLRIFLLDQGYKRLIVGPGALAGLGLQYEPVVPVNITEFLYYPTGDPIYQ